MIDLESALTELAEHLDHPEAEHSAAALRERLVATGRGARHPRRARALLAAAALLAVVSTGVVAIAPARHALADWLGIGAVEIRTPRRLPVPAPATGRTVPGATGSPPTATATKRLAAARKAVHFSIATPHSRSAGPLAAVDVDRRVPGGLVTLAYPRFTLVEIATDPARPPLLGKAVGGAAIEQVRVDGEAGIWVPSTHEIAFIDRSGNYETDTVRRAGPVLLWERAGVTYRIEGLRTLAEAQIIARSIR